MIQKIDITLWESEKLLKATSLRPLDPHRQMKSIENDLNPYRSL